MPTATDPCKRVFSIFTIIIREPQRQIRDRINKIVPIPPSPIFKNQGIRGLLVRVTPYTVGFWCQTIHKKFLQRFDTSFDIKMMVKIYAIEITFKSHEPFQSYLLTAPANSARKAG